METGSDGEALLSVTPALPLFEVFGMTEGSTTYWTVVLAAAFLIVAAILTNQIANRTLILKE